MAFEPRRGLRKEDLRLIRGGFAKGGTSVISEYEGKDGRHYAVKDYKRDRIEEIGEVIPLARSLSALQEITQHPLLTTLVTVEYPHYTIMDYVPGVNLQDFARTGVEMSFIKDAEFLSLSEADQYRYVMQGLFAILDVYRQNSLVDLDLKASNLMLTYGLSGPSAVKQIDHELILSPEFVENYRSSPEQTSGTMSYWSREEIRERNLIGAETNMFKAGMVLHELLAKGRLPVHDKLDSLGKGSSTGEVHFVQMMLVEQPQMPNPIEIYRNLDIDNNLANLFVEMTRRDPEKRISLENALDRLRDGYNGPIISIPYNPAA